ncbi:hypothetical protein NEUTE1DRAFT_47138 [Neurospora tetrasperma FGSC 2508]|uniref:Uncharacterized protein n=1 Tax=Neurospora tetrasperma (strain FGSC 2508 / ATCC MYA-4615 / P0657) TaxID=510951 RepID=F8MT47_NEUT8|nr:uncharacterized protein NEUTE1DRAFT_47138 [Neurospora tetrasperma FGSC 2508]EGO55179.1 hypothetical protein NEUTE1DRAFT_47138 [Neurospora tetrasperma FGSC 2508]EGZ69605.1 hypothetical protein NEUTE2DRAFT_169200 [Neurospora tetrasperma FGSC 2509]
MSSNMYTEGLISLINIHEKNYPHDSPTDFRFGYAVGLVGLTALNVSGDYTAQEFHDTIRDYAATLRKERALAETDENHEMTAKLLSREFICYDMLDVVCELQSNRSETKANKGIVSNNDMIVNKEDEVVINKNDIVHVDEDNEFVLISDVESETTDSEADSSEWELV